MNQSVICKARKAGSFGHLPFFHPVTTILNPEYGVREPKTTRPWIVDRRSWESRGYCTYFDTRSEGAKLKWGDLSTLHPRQGGINEYQIVVRHP